MLGWGVQIGGELWSHQGHPVSIADYLSFTGSETNRCRTTAVQPLVLQLLLQLGNAEKDDSPATQHKWIYGLG